MGSLGARGLPSYVTRPDSKLTAKAARLNLGLGRAGTAYYCARLGISNVRMLSSGRPTLQPDAWVFAGYEAQHSTVQYTITILA